MLCVQQDSAFVNDIFGIIWPRKIGEHYAGGYSKSFEGLLLFLLFVVHAGDADWCTGLAVSNAWMGLPHAGFGHVCHLQVQPTPDDSLDDPERRIESLQGQSCETLHRSAACASFVQLAFVRQ